MNRVAEIEKAVNELSQKEYAEFRQRFLERDWERWDHQIEQDVASGNLDFLIQEAMNDKQNSKLKLL
ncbi:hypothetical protein K8I31_09790 [bacterium]|nr:hypothetical protein [bacterium]